MSDFIEENIVFPILDDRVQDRLVVGTDIEDHGGSFGQVGMDLTEGLRHVLAIMHVPEHDGQTDRYCLGLVRDHGLVQLGQVGPLGLECADDRIETEAFEERLGPDKVADEN